MTSQLLLDRLRDDVVDVVDTVLALADVRLVLMAADKFGKLWTECYHSFTVAFSNLLLYLAKSKCLALHVHSSCLIQT